VVRWPSHIRPGTVSNEIFSGHDWFPTLLAAAGDSDVRDRLLKGWQVGGRTYKVHLDGYNQLAYLTGQQDKSDRRGFIYFDDDGHLVALRWEDWKFVFAEQKTPGTLGVWGEPFTMRRFPLFFNLPIDTLRTRADHVEHLLGLDAAQGLPAPRSPGACCDIHGYVQ
jgi:arylsulfatase A-like enzyme